MSWNKDPKLCQANMECMATGVHIVKGRWDDYGLCGKHYREYVLVMPFSPPVASEPEKRRSQNPTPQ